jgi:hypothetical protein
MHWIGKTALAVLGAEVALSVGPRRWQRQRIYRAAQDRADETGKPLVIIGAPRAGLVTRLLPTYGCGDLCVDLNGCSTCAAQRKGDVAVVLADFANDSAVVCVICTLEYVEDIDGAMAALTRVAGGNLFVARVEPWSLTAFVCPGAQRRLTAVPEGDGGQLTYKPLLWQR